MSRQRSRSPRYRSSPPRHEGAGSHSRRPPWNVDSGSHMGPAETDGIPFERNRHPRDDSGEHWNYFREETRQAPKRRTPPFREETRQAGKRRSPPFRETRQPGQQHHPHPEEFCRRTPPSQPREPSYAERRRLSPKQPFHRHEGGDRGRGDLRVFEDEERQHLSPQRLPRERFLPNPTAPSHPNHQQQREQPVINWAREGRGRSRDRGARSRSHDHGQREGRKDPQGPYKEQRRAEPHHERSPAFSNRQRREMDDALNHGYGNEEEEFSSPEKPRDGFGGGDRELRGPQKGFSHREDRGARPVIVEHDHGITNSGPPQWDRDLDLDGESRPLQKGSLHEQFRMLNRSNAREELRHRPLHDDGGDPGRDRESSRSPMRRDRTSPTGFPDGGGPSNYRDRSPPDPGRGRMNPSWGRGRMGNGPPRNHPPLQQLPQERHGPPQQPQRRENRSAGVGDFYMDSREEDPGWTEEDMEPKMPRGRADKWNSQQNANEEDMEPKIPRGREHKWNSQQNTNEMTVVTEETLTIKVDMSRPVNRNSLLCYSSDRQLSLDLVNVGRQRLDFLPMLEHSGTYRESSMHTGTFAQEIITLVHQVKEVYFGGYGTTLNERFRVLKEAVSPEKEQAVEQLTLNRRFNMNMTALPEDEPLFSRLGDMHDDSLFSRLGDMQPPRQQQQQQQQMVRDPGDLRYDLERRRQERLEGVKVTIPGGSLKQYPLGVRSDQNAEYDDQESSDQGEKGEFSSWSGEEQQERRWRGNMGPRRGGPNRQNSGPQRRNHRPGTRPGQMRWQNNRNNGDAPVGANW